MKIFCERIKELRLERKLTTTALAEKLGVSHSTIIRWENNSIVPSIDYLYKIAVFFGVSADYLIGLEN